MHVPRIAQSKDMNMQIFKRPVNLLLTQTGRHCPCEDVDEPIIQWSNCFLGITKQCIPKASFAKCHNLP